MYSIFDAHCHIYPEAIALKAVEGIDRFYEHLPFRPYDGTTGTLLRIGREAGISRFLVHSVATAPRQISSINRFIASEVSLSNGAFTGLGTLHPDAANLERDFKVLRMLGLKGVKLHPDIQRFHLDDERLMPLYELMSAEGLFLIAHTGDYRYDFSTPARMAHVAKTFPKLRCIAPHFGGWSVWDDAVRTLSGFDNIIVDTSSTFYALGRNRAKALIRQWGADRMMFGTDYPMWNPKPEIDCLTEMGLTEDEYRRIFWENAANLFGPGGI